MNESMNVWNQMFKNYKENKTEEWLVYVPNTGF